MSQIVDTRPADPDDPELDVRGALDGLDDTRVVSGSDLGERVWRLFVNMRTGLLLILVLGLLSFIGTMLEQAPSGVRADPQAYASWLETIQPKYGGWTNVFDTLGLFSVFTSLWFKGTAVLLSTSILACSVNRAPLLWKLAARPRTHKGEAFFAHAPLRAELVVAEDGGSAMDAVRKTFRGKRFRTIDDPNDGGLNLYADKNRWGPTGTVLAHVSFVIILLGAVLSATTGFKDTEFTASTGSRVPVGHGTGLSIELKTFSDSYYPDGSPRDYASDLVLYKNGKQVKAQTVRVNQPMRYGGVSFFQSFFGVAAAMQVKDAKGATLYDRGVPMAYASDDGSHSIGQFAIPSKRLSVYVITAASGQVDPNIKAGQVQLEIHRDGVDDPIATEVISMGKPATIAGQQYTFERTEQFTGLIVSRDRGAMIVWVGSTLFVIGLVLVFFFPHRRVWVRVRSTPDGGSNVRVAATMRRDPAFEPKFHQMVADLESRVTPTGTTTTSEAERC
jgi:cytochrome c biogenesis protein